MSTDKKMIEAVKKDMGILANVAVEHSMSKSEFLDLATSKYVAAYEKAEAAVNFECHLKMAMHDYLGAFYTKAKVEKIFETLNETDYVKLISDTLINDMIKANSKLDERLKAQMKEATVKNDKVKESWDKGVAAAESVNIKAKESGDTMTNCPIDYEYNRAWTASFTDEDNKTIVDKIWIGDKLIYNRKGSDDKK